MYGIYIQLFQKVGAVMPAGTSNGIETWLLRTSKEQWIRWVYWLISIAIIMYAWQMISEKTVWFFVTDAPSQAADIASRMVPPKWSYMDKLWKPVWDTINIATIGTIIAMVIAVPVAFATARNTTPKGSIIIILQGVAPAAKLVMVHPFIPSLPRALYITGWLVNVMRKDECEGIDPGK